MEGTCAFRTAQTQHLIRPWTGPYSSADEMSAQPGDRLPK